MLKNFPAAEAQLPAFLQHLNQLHRLRPDIEAEESWHLGPAIFHPHFHVASLDGDPVHN